MTTLQDQFDKAKADFESSYFNVAVMVFESAWLHEVEKMVEARGKYLKVRKQIERAEIEQADKSTRPL